MKEDERSRRYEKTGRRRALAKDISGFGAMFRWSSDQRIRTSTIRFRAVAGVAEGAYIFAVLGSTGASKDAWDEILVYPLGFPPPCLHLDRLDAAAEGVSRMNGRSWYPWSLATASIHQEKRDRQEAA